MSIRNRMCILIMAGGAACSALAHEQLFRAELGGANMSPPTPSTAHGHVTVIVDFDLVTLHVQASFDDLSSGATRARIHGLTPIAFEGVAASAVLDPSLPSFPLGVTAGIYDATIDLTTADAYSPAFIVASGGTVSDALNALIAGLQQGRTYFQIDSSLMPSGEVRGFLVQHGLPGDMNCDEVITVGDIAGFVLALTDPAAYAIQYPGCDEHNADINGDEFVTVGDIGGFVSLLTGR